MLAIITLQSAFAAVDMTVVDRCVYGEHKEYDTELDPQQEIQAAQEDSHKDCPDCNCKCCPCCSNVMFALVAMPVAFKSFDPFIINFEPPGFDTPYYSLLRPPKI